MEKKIFNFKVELKFEKPFPDAKGFYMAIAYNEHGHYIGDVKNLDILLEKGIVPELKPAILAKVKNGDTHPYPCSIGKSVKDGKWYGWSHRAMFGFQVGDKVKKGDCTASSGWTDEYLKKHPEEDLSLPIGFEAKTEEDAKRMAIAFADSVS